MTYEPRRVREIAAQHGISADLVAELAELAMLVELRREAVARLVRWHAAGRPQGNTNRLAFAGHPTVRRIVAATICNLPPPIRHYAVEAVTWRESGRGNGAWFARAHRSRSLPGDVAHEVNLCGRERDEDIPQIAAHEISHGIYWPLELPDDDPDADEQVPIILDAHEALTARILSQRARSEDDKTMDRAVWIGQRVHSELLADRQADAWGHRRRPGAADELELRRHFAELYDRAAEYAAQLDEEASTARRALAGDIGGTP